MNLIQLMRGREIHGLFAINSTTCSVNYIKHLPFLHQNIYLHVCFMGGNTEKIEEATKKWDGRVLNKIIMPSNMFNYSFCINLLLKPLSENIRDKDLAVISDGYSMFPTSMVFGGIGDDNYNMFDFDNNFVCLTNLLYETLDFDQINMEKFKVSQAQKFIIKPNSQLYIPLVITELKNLVYLENGLNEDIFTEYSRINLSNQLEKGGLKKVTSPNKAAMSAKKRNIYDPLVERDLITIENIKINSKNMIFIPSNYKVEWGVFSKLSSLSIKNGLPEWENKNKVSESNNDTDTENKILDYSDKNNQKNKSIRWTAEKKEPRSKKERRKIELEKFPLIIVNSKLKNLICITPMIKRIFEKVGPVDILTKSKNPHITNVLKGIMTRKLLNYIEPNDKIMHEYRTIIATEDVDSEIPNIPKNSYRSTIKGSNLIETNYSIISDMICDIPIPYCNFTMPKLQIQPGTICFCFTVKKEYQKNLSLWNKYNILISRLANEMTNIFILNYVGENVITEDKKLSTRKNIKIINTPDILECAGIIKHCSVVITHQYSDLSWISYGIKNRSVMFHDDSYEIPDSNWISKININENTPLEYLVNKIWSML